MAAPWAIHRRFGDIDHVSARSSTSKAEQPVRPSRPAFLLTAVLALVFAAAACTSSDGLSATPASGPTSEPTVDGSATDSGAGESTETAPGPALEEPSAEVLAQVAELPGRLAVGQSNQLAVMNPDGTGFQWLDDAADVVATQPVWSADGDRLAWSRATVDSHELVVVDAASGERVVSPAAGPSAFYMQWSADDEALAYLRNDVNGRGIEFGFAVPGSEAQALVATSPFYVSWSPTGSSVAAHVADQQVVVLPDLLDEPVADLEDPIVLLDPAGEFTVPVWLDASTLLVASTEGLSLFDVNSSRVATIVDSPTHVQFVVSPDRLKVAYRLRGVGAGLSTVALGQVDAFGGLLVLDLASGETTTVTDQTPLAWEWSPDSTKLAWLGSGFSALRPLTRWNFWDGEETIVAEPYQASRRELQTYLPFFEQYAQSHTRWSPDGTAFAFAGRSGSTGSEEIDYVWIQLVEADTPPVRVAEGDLAIWSS